MKINRMIEMITILLNRKTVTAKELAERFEVSTRTIYRDIDVLSGAGIPIYTNKGSGGGISLLDNYTLDKTMISEEERDSLILGLTTLKATKYPEIDKMLEKLSAVFKKQDTNDWIEVDFTPWGTSPNSYHKFDDVKQAILCRQVLEFEYMSASKQRIKRKVEPLKLIFKSREWYMWGFCRIRKEYRLFKLSRMKNHRLLDERFEHRSRSYDHEKEKMTDGSYAQRFTVFKFKFKESALYRVYDDFDDDYIKENQDGTYEVTVAFPEGEWVYNYIFSFGEEIEVLEPEPIRKNLRMRLQQALGYYIEQDE